jgi:hypothetical protein
LLLVEAEVAFPPGDIQVEEVVAQEVYLPGIQALQLALLTL